MEDPSAYPYLFAELMGHGWSIEELTKLAGANLLRVMSEVKICISKNFFSIACACKGGHNFHPFGFYNNFVVLSRREREKMSTEHREKVFIVWLLEIEPILWSLSE